MSKNINPHRREFLGAAAMTVAAVQLGIVGSASGQPNKEKSSGSPSGKTGTHTSFGPLKQIEGWRLKYRLRRVRAGRRAAGYSSARLAL